MKLVGISGLQSAHAFSNSVGGIDIVAKRLAGLGADEIDAGIPGWAYALIGLGAGAALTYVFRNKIEEVVGR